MIPILLMAILTALAGVSLADTTHVFAGGVSGSWTREHGPYVVSGDIEVREGARLRIEPGVEVRFTGPYSMTIRGALIVGKKSGKLRESDGEKTQTTVFTTDTVANPEGWRGLRFLEAEDCALVNCKITAARAVGDGVSGIGGAVFCRNTELAIANCSIVNNRAEASGGGIAVIGGSVAIANFEISGNSAGMKGGGIFSDKGAEVALANGIFEDNYGGGIACAGGSEVALANVKILDNTGFGIFTDSSEISIVNAEILGNSEGGLVIRNGSEASMVNCILGGANPFDREDGCEVAKINVSIKD